MNEVSVRGKTYRIKPPTMRLVARAFKLGEMFDSETMRVNLTEENLPRLSASWKEYCETILENPDEDLEFADLTMEDVSKITLNFFVCASRIDESVFDTLKNTVVEKAVRR